MLVEHEHVRQILGEGYRRWFADDYFDLIVWYDDLNNFMGFQLCYNKNTNEYALTWLRGNIFRHERIDSGESAFASRKTPIALKNGPFNKKRISELFKKESKFIDKNVADFVYNKLLVYEQK